MNGTYVCTLHPLMSGKIFAKNETSTIIPTDEPSPPVNNNNEVENSTNTIDNKTDVNVTNGGDTTKPANIFTLSICFFISLILIFFWSMMLGQRQFIS